MKIIFFIVTILCGVSSLSFASENQNNIIAKPLSTSEISALDSDRKWVADLLKGIGSKITLNRTTEDIATLHSLIDGCPYSSNLDAELIVFGTVFGDVIENSTGMHWVSISDQYGQDLALQFENREIYVFPRDMLIKRVEKGEKVNEINLNLIHDEVLKTVNTLKSKSGIK